VPFQWRGWYDFGCGALGDMACHVLGAPNMALLLGAPTSVECIRQDSKSPYCYPMKSSIRLDFPARKNMPALKLFWHDGARGLPDEYWPAAVPKDERLGDLPSRPNNNAGGRGPTAAANVRRAPAVAPAPDPTAAALSARIAPYNTPPSSGALFIGDKGYMTTGEYGAAPRLLPSAKMDDYQFPAPLLVRHPETFTDWVRACKGGDPGASNFKIAAPFTEWIAMACIALRVEGRLDWDAARMQFTNNRLANEYLKPTFRKGWSFT